MPLVKVRPAPIRAPGRICAGAQPSAESALTAKKRAGCMPAMPATRGTPPRTGATKRERKTLLPPCMAKNFSP